ncbi:M48 family metallopeptidase [Candidatus Saccharibacteria bacterium]|nr:MAG: M48 family metallopeptidase [Candidatus Saccharibacteria bacterium]
MATKIIEVPEIGFVSFTKTAQSKSIRISVTAHGVRVTLPRWTPYFTAVTFVRQHTDWIRLELAKTTPTTLKEGDKIGKLHNLHFEQIPERSEAKSRVTATKLIIYYHPGETLTSEAVQTRAEQAAIRALKKEARVLLVPRLQAKAEKNSLTCGTVTIKHLKRRWGSCDSNGNITLNLFLMQLSWQQIDYVICHELAHTQHMNHSAAFWQAVESLIPDARMIAKRVRHIQPALIPRPSTEPLEE